jgi:proteasome alpha subunit
VAELGQGQRETQLFHVAYEGTITDEDRFAVLGGEAEPIRQAFASAYTDDWDLAHALRAAVDALSGPDRTLAPSDLEVAVLADANGRRSFRRIDDAELATLLAS